jgi:hypothetical protein
MSVSDEQKLAPCQSYYWPKYQGASVVVVKEVWRVLGF